MYRMLVWVPARFVLMSLSVVLPAACAVAQTARPNILWINAEDLSPHFGCYGDALATTPNIDGLAAKGVMFQNAFATAPICSPSRSCLATGMYATSLGTQHLRSELRIPDRVVPLANQLRQLGYFCTNTGKTDYNFDATGIWDAWNNREAPWRARQDNQPFFAFITISATHESRVNFQDRYEKATADLAPEDRHDPTKVKLPPYYPDTTETRRIFANLYDLITVFDRKVEQVLSWLEQDGDLENTIVFVFSDHGNGLPRYKRWLNNSGLRVPLVVYIPDTFQELSPHPPGAQTDQLVSLVDFAATAIALAGGEVPATMPGIPFLGQTNSEPRKFVFGARSRADDMFEVSRSICDGRYFYVRHFMPHLPYIQTGKIFDDSKRAFRELRLLHRAGLLNPQVARIWSDEKPLEELYDLQEDPFELKNLADVGQHADVKQQLAAELKKWILQHRDSGFLPETEYQIQAAEAELTPFDIVQDAARYQLDAALEAAWQVGDRSVPLASLGQGLSHTEPAVRYWSAVAALARIDDTSTLSGQLQTALQDSSPAVRIAAAEALVAMGNFEPALTALGENLKDDRPWVALAAARAIALIGEPAKPLVPIMQQVLNKNRSAAGSRPVYRDTTYASFTRWALETALAACGEPVVRQ